MKWKYNGFAKGNIATSLNLFFNGDMRFQTALLRFFVIKVPVKKGERFHFCVNIERIFSVTYQIEILCWRSGFGNSCCLTFF